MSAVALGNEGPASKEELKKNAIFGYGMFDWAKSAYETSVVTVLLPAWFAYLFVEAKGDGIEIGSFLITSDNMWALLTMISALMVAVVSPALGVIADRTTMKMKALKIFSWVGSGATVFLIVAYFMPMSFAWAVAAVFFFIANVGLNASSVFYNALLPYMGDETEMDSISNKAFAYGYLGGGLLLAIHLLMYTFIEGAWVVPLAISSSGIWWFGFAIFTFKHIPEPHVENVVEIKGVNHASKLAITELKKTLGEWKKFRILFTYMLAYFLFIDGINTVTALAGVYGVTVLGIDTGALIVVILIIQFVGAPAALAFTKLAEATSTKTGLFIACIGWCFVILMGIGFAPLQLETHEEHDFMFDWNEGAGAYNVSISDDGLLSTSTADKKMLSDWKHILPLSDGELSVDETGLASASNATEFMASLEDTRFSASISEGETIVGLKHPTNIGDEVGDGFAVFLRNNLWGPLGMSVTIQFMLLGLMAGSLMGGSQGLARSMFGQIVPETRSTEFFGFFGFFGKVAAFLGPFLYFAIGGFFGSRAALLSIAALIIAGTIILKRVDVESGIAVAREEDRKNRMESAESSQSQNEVISAEE